jgi:acyl-CoA reductase-like NAD-dependent aldehyde dehydrogenase
MAPSILDFSIERLRASITEGRPESVRFRQNEFQRLHAALRENSASICDAISKDESCSTADSEKEFYLTMDALRTFYETLDFDHLLKQEYLVKEGKDNRNRRVGLGLVAIRPSSHSQFYSVLVPLGAAIAAGNCVILEVRFFAKTKQDGKGCC